MLVICGACTVKFTVGVLGTPPTVTCTGPLGAVAGTVTTICVSLQLTIEAAWPANVIVLAPCVAPNPLPLIWTWTPTGPSVGMSPAMTGFGMVNTKS